MQQRNFLEYRSGKGSLKESGYQYTAGAPLRFFDFSGANFAKKMAPV